MCVSTRSCISTSRYNTTARGPNSNYKLTTFKVSLLQKLDCVLFASHCRFLPLGEQLAEYFVSLTLCVFSSSNVNGQERKIRGMKVLASSARRNMTYVADLIERGRECILLRNNIEYFKMNG